MNAYLKASMKKNQTVFLTKHRKDGNEFKYVLKLKLDY